jgi:hypothetical protein
MREITLRVLRPGASCQGELLWRKSNEIQIRLLEEAPEVAAPAAVEITDGNTLFLGMMLARQADTAMVMLEHRVDRGLLERMRAMWPQAGE